MAWLLQVLYWSAVALPLAGWLRTRQLRRRRMARQGDDDLLPGFIFQGLLPGLAFSQLAHHRVELIVDQHMHFLYLPHVPGCEQDGAQPRGSRYVARDHGTSSGTRWPSETPELALTPLVCRVPVLDSVIRLPLPARVCWTPNVMFTFGM